PEAMEAALRAPRRVEISVGDNSPHLLPSRSASSLFGFTKWMPPQAWQVTDTKVSGSALRSVVKPCTVCPVRGQWKRKASMAPSMGHIPRSKFDRDQTPTKSGSPGRVGLPGLRRIGGFFKVPAVPPHDQTLLADSHRLIMVRRGLLTIKLFQFQC